MKNKKMSAPIANAINYNNNNIENFINEFKSNKNPNIIKLTENYSELYLIVKNTLLTLSKMEELIVQKNTRNNISSISLDIINGYIYARHSFFRTDRDLKDVRVIIAKVDLIKETFKYKNITDLLKQPEFCNICRIKLTKAMDKIIDKTNFEIQLLLDQQLMNNS